MGEELYQYKSMVGNDGGQWLLCIVRGLRTAQCINTSEQSECQSCCIKYKRPSWWRWGRTGSQSTATNYQLCDMWLATVQFQIKLNFSHTHLTSTHRLAHHLACIDTADLTQPVPTIIAHCMLVLIQRNTVSWPSGSLISHYTLDLTLPTICLYWYSASPSSSPTGLLVFYTVTLTQITCLYWYIELVLKEKISLLACIDTLWCPAEERPFIAYVLSAMTKIQMRHLPTRYLII